MDPPSPPPPGRSAPLGTLRAAGRPVPARVAKYEIRERIGSGGFGEVYRGWDPDLRRDVAIKTCHAEDEELRARFSREARLAGSLQHRNVTTVYDYGVENGVPYIVQEFLPGEDLERMLARGVPLSLETKLEVLIGLAYGLHAAHDAGIVHRDVKPGNVRILPNGTVKIMDFGVAKSLGGETSRTRTGITLGTSAYLAPEQIRGEPVDRRTDVFALGVIAYELLAGRRPFTASTPDRLFDEIEKQSPPPLSDAARELPPGLAAAVERALAKDPAARYPSADALRQDLARVLEERRARSAAPARPIEAAKEAPPPAARSRSRRTAPVWIALLLAALAAGALLLAGVL